MTQVINRARNMFIGRGKYSSRQDIDIPDELKRTIDSKYLFIWDDSGADDPNRIIIFSTEMSIDILNNSSEWYVDGTFQVSPLLYKQILTINIIFHGKNLPIVYTFLPNKQEITYTKFFEMLLNNEIKCIERPVGFIVDYELAIINSIDKSFECKISGCYFHYVQSMWRNVSTKGLIPLFNNDPAVTLGYRRIKALPFLKLNHVIRGFKLIANEVPSNFKPLNDFFEEYYIGKLVNNSNSMRVKPNFPKELWNVYERTLEGIPRTNNSLKSWHKQFAQSMTHPDVNDLVNKFREEQHSMELSYKQLKSSDYYQRKKN